ncbi:helix-turn-helix domain-containing protein [Microbacterium esteraromaticum]|uniref:helix-turn-helix domain-containing protein n=1 Tax=Microbacterium esteraromaticum TaxID=57043 RepID=UPI0021BD22C9|nr:helix-turn-helix domain-containing protein [Microbacterium esteraromaticum]
MSDNQNLVNFGQNIKAWRTLSRLPATIVAERAGITRDTLRSLEGGAGSVKLENVFAVLEALGLDSKLRDALDPMSDERGRALIRRRTGGGRR